MNRLTDEVGKIFDAISDERMEHCIHCNAHWYSIQYKDGVCHKCQQKGLSGRIEIEEKDKRTRRGVLVLVAVMFISVIIYVLTH